MSEFLVEICVAVPQAVSQGLSGLGGGGRCLLPVVRETKLARNCIGEDTVLDLKGIFGCNISLKTI